MPTGVVPNPIIIITVIKVRVNFSLLSTSLQDTVTIAFLPNVLKRNRVDYPGFLHKLEQQLVFKESQAFQEPLTECPDDCWLERPASPPPLGRSAGKVRPTDQLFICVTYVVHENRLFPGPKMNLKAKSAPAPFAF